MRKHVLVTNDDGPDSAGLISLAKAAIALGWHVTVALPAADMSHSGTSLGHALVHAVQFTSSPSHPEIACDEYLEVRATPSAIVTLAAMSAFGPRPDLVLVGINPGINVGRGLIHSSTVGAALTAAVHDIPGVAVSSNWRADLAGQWHDALVSLLAALPDLWPPDGILNVNLPELPVSEAGKVTWCAPVKSAAVGTLIAERDSFRVSYSPLSERPPANTDFGAVLNGGVALTWLSLPYTASAFTTEWGADLITRLHTQWRGTPASKGMEVPQP